MIKGRPTMASTVVLRAQAASLRRDYPGWRVWVSTAGRIWAQRRMPDFTMDELPPDLYPRLSRWEVYDSVDGDTALEVREKIAAKEGR